MKKLTKSVLIIALSIIFQHLPAQTVSVSGTAGTITYQTFYDRLSPFGTWIDYPDHGQVWRPRVEVGFRPYLTNGFWEYTDDGWYWDSGYDWGWAPFHYGNWLYDDNLGWLWIPGYDWAPAWVVWGNIDGYYAWAPLEPGIEGRRPHDFYWNMVGRDHILDRNLSDRALDKDRVREQASRISVARNSENNRADHTHFSQGPDIKDVQRFTNQKVNPVSIKDAAEIPTGRRIDNNIPAYRPVVQKTEPAEFSKATVDDIKPINSFDNNRWPEERMDNERQMDNVRSMPVMHSEMGGMRGMGMPAMHGGGGRR